MREIVLMAGVSAAAFVSTNVDNLFLLMALLGGSPRRARAVAVGYAAALAVVLAVCVAGSWAFELAANAWLRYLGLVPLGLGLWRLRQLLGRGSPSVAGAPPPRAAGVGASFGLMLGNSGDSLAVFASLLGETEGGLIPVAVVTILGMALLWVAAARGMVSHPALAPPLQRLERWGVPLLLVAVGLYILLDTATDTV